MLYPSNIICDNTTGASLCRTSQHTPQLADSHPGSKVVVELVDGGPQCDIGVHGCKQLGHMLIPAHIAQDLGENSRMVCMCMGAVLYQCRVQWCGKLMQSCTASVRLYTTLAGIAMMQLCAMHLHVQYCAASACAGGMKAYFVMPQPNIFSCPLISSAVCTAACSLDCSSVACSHSRDRQKMQQLIKR